MSEFTCPVNVYIAVSVENSGSRCGGSAAMLEYCGSTKVITNNFVGNSCYDHILLIGIAALRELKGTGLDVVFYSTSHTFVQFVNQASAYYISHDTGSLFGDDCCADLWFQFSQEAQRHNVSARFVGCEDIPQFPYLYQLAVDEKEKAAGGSLPAGGGTPSLPPIKPSVLDR